MREEGVFLRWSPIHPVYFIWFFVIVIVIVIVTVTVTITTVIVIVIVVLGTFMSLFLSY